MCLLGQTAYLVLLAVYVSCADRCNWLLCILCPCVNCLYIRIRRVWVIVECRVSRLGGRGRGFEVEVEVKKSRSRLKSRGRG